MLNKGDFTISTFTKNETVSEVIGLVLSEMKSMKERTVSSEELLKSKTYLCGLFPLGFETTGLKLRILSDMFFYGLDRKYIDNYSDHIHSVAKEDVLYVAQNYFDSDN